MNLTRGNIEAGVSSLAQLDCDKDPAELCHVNALAPKSANFFNSLKYLKPAQYTGTVIAESSRLCSDFRPKAIEEACQWRTVKKSASDRVDGLCSTKITAEFMVTVKEEDFSHLKGSAKWRTTPATKRYW
jgi:hypothetical protein